MDWFNDVLLPVCCYSIPSYPIYICYYCWVVSMIPSVAEFLFVLAACCLGKEKKVRFIQRYFIWMHHPLFIWLLITKYLSYTITFIHVETLRGCMLHGTSQQGLLERGGSMVHVLQNRKRKGTYVNVCATSFQMRVCVWRRLTACLIRLGVRKGVGRRTSPFCLKNHSKRFTVVSQQPYIN